MPDQRYEVFSEKRVSSPLTQRGFFSDLAVVNYSSTPVIMVDIHNNQYVIQPQSKTAPANGLIELVYRSTDTPRVDPTQRHTTVEQPIAATKVTCKVSELDLGSLYIEEMEVVLCLPDQAPAIVHPKSTSAYEYAIREASVMITSNDSSPKVSIYANDPKGYVTELYAYLFGKIVPCPVTAMPNRESTITILVNIGNQVVAQKSYSIDEFLNQKKFIKERNVPLLCISSSRLLVEQYVANMERETDKLSDEALQIMKAEVEYAAAKKHESVVSDYEKKLNDANWESDQLSQKNRQLQFKLSESDNQVAMLNSQLSGFKAIFANHEQLASLTRSGMQTAAVKEKTKQAQIATSTEQIKQSEVIWKVVGGASIAIITALITTWLKDRK